jgi:hypothetical protein
MLAGKLLALLAEQRLIHRGIILNVAIQESRKSSTISQSRSASHSSQRLPNLQRERNQPPHHCPNALTVS